MSLNSTPSGERLHIGFFGRRNAGKSSVVNAVTGQELAVVSDVLGTTTDPVYKAMELLPLGPVMIIDTPGFDDEGDLGELRIRKTKQVLNKSDIAILVVDSQTDLSSTDAKLIDMFKQKQLPYIIAYNKVDLVDDKKSLSDNEIYISAKDKTNINELKEKIGSMTDFQSEQKRLVGDLLNEGDLVVLVVPIDSSAPKGRLILPQQQTIRDILDAGAISVVARDTELSLTLEKLGTKPAMVITDSQAFKQVSAVVPQNIKLTSFSILMARYKGLLDSAVHGAIKISDLKDGDKVLISEGCTHHRQCEDIGTVKLPNWLRKFTGKELEFVFSSGMEFPEDLSEYALVIHCGGCMLNEREVRYRMKCANDQNVPITNYGTSIAYMNGILKRSLSVFSEYDNM
ncbi:MAG: [FeFe] hydrogenase H-cluster maturation GTPase HydF [Ruminococcus sp.]|nr:[FeFe] hydrogenase H-cluster maturation GTPase HydF [Ruminococcus sp.]